MHVASDRWTLQHLPMCGTRSHLQGTDADVFKEKKKRGEEDTCRNEYRFLFWFFSCSMFSLFYGHLHCRTTTHTLTGQIKVQCSTLPRKQIHQLLSVSYLASSFKSNIICLNLWYFGLGSAHYPVATFLLFSKSTNDPEMNLRTL